MQAQIKKWGNSQGIIIPKEILRKSGITMDDELEIEAQRGVITIAIPFRHKTLEERIAESGGVLRLTGELDLGEPVGRELL